MKKEWLVKTLALGIVILFICMSTIPVIESLSVEKHISTKEMICKSYSRYDNDTTPPITTISFDPAEPNGENGWYKRIPDIYFEAIDDLSGVNHTYARIDGGCWIEVFGSIIFVGEDGEYTIYYFSVDKAGNTEEVKSATFKFDTTPPEILVDWEVNKIDGKWIVNFIITCDYLEGGRIEIYMNNELLETIVGGDGSTYYFSIEWSTTIKTAVLKFLAYDEAGNSAVVIIDGSDIKSYSFIHQFRNQLMLRLLKRFQNNFPLLKYVLGGR